MLPKLLPSWVYASNSPFCPGVALFLSIATAQLDSQWDSAHCFDLEKLDSVYTWRKSWFYLKDQHVDGQRFVLAPFDPVARVARRPSWSNYLSSGEVSL